MRLPSILAALALAAGCARAPEAPAIAPYDPPITYNAKKAFLAGYAADTDAIEIGEPPDIASPNPLTTSMMQAQNYRRLEKEHGAQAVGAFQKLVMGTCVWGAYSERDVPPLVRKRVGEKPDGAYRCRYVAHFQINPPYGKKYAVDGEGWFFERDGALVYAGKYPNPYL